MVDGSAHRQRSDSRRFQGCSRPPRAPCTRRYVRIRPRHTRPQCHTLGLAGLITATRHHCQKWSSLLSAERPSTATSSGRRPLAPGDYHSGDLAAFARRVVLNPNLDRKLMIPDVPCVPWMGLTHSALTLGISMALVRSSGTRCTISRRVEMPTSTIGAAEGTGARANVCHRREARGERREARGEV